MKILERFENENDAHVVEEIEEIESVDAGHWAAEEVDADVVEEVDCFHSFLGFLTLKYWS